MSAQPMRYAPFAALVLGLALALGAAGPTLAQADARARCIQEAARAGLLGADLNPGNANFVGGTDDNDHAAFWSARATTGRDVFCGFDGEDQIGSLGAGDVFLGGDGIDSVVSLVGGTFNGGDGNDHVFNLHGGTFNGGDGDDQVIDMLGGTFNGGPGTDDCRSVQLPGICNLGPQP